MANKANLYSSNRIPSGERDSHLLKLILMDAEYPSISARILLGAKVLVYSYPPQLDIGKVIISDFEEGRKSLLKFYNSLIEIKRHMPSYLFVSSDFDESIENAKEYLKKNTDKFLFLYTDELDITPKQLKNEILEFYDTTYTKILNTHEMNYENEDLFHEIFKNWETDLNLEFPDLK